MSPQRIGLIAGREIATTVLNKGFLFGLLIMPAMFALIAVVAPRIMSSRPQVRGQVAIVDPTTQVAGELRTALDPATLEKQRAERIAREAERAAPGTGDRTEQAVQSVIGRPPVLQLVERPAGGDLEAEKARLIAPPDGQADRLLALVVIHADAIARQPGKLDYGTYDLYVATALDNQTEEFLTDGLRQAIVDLRLRAGQFDREAIQATMRVADPTSTIVAASGEQASSRGFQSALPFILGVLLFMGVMIGGQTLMTSTIEEKSSRVIEVLLAAVSPMELMMGKLLGQLAVGLLVMSIYVGLGIFALFQFAMFGLLDPMLVVYLLVFFLVTYLLFGALMMSIGAAVNQMNEAQSLLGPVMILLIVPYVLAPIIGQAPNSPFSIAVSFIPPINTFAMMSRLASSTPPPAWQVWLTVAVGAGAAFLTVWFAAKVFKIGLLMHGKPPSIATLFRWARMA
jgi:ABC-2 type transport system permease protein